MARIPEGVIERLKREVSVERLAEARGVELKRHGADLMGRCPFHEDRTPSLVVTPSKNLWHCLGACQAGGTAIDWVMKAEGVSFRHAVELLQNDYLPVASAGPVPKQSTVRKLAPPVEREAGDATLLAQVIDYYYQTLLGSPEALEYLKRRGIGSSEAVATFKLGYANRTLGYRLPAKTRVEGAALRGRLQRIGILRESGHEHLSGSLVIPVLSESGEVLEAYGRKLNDHLRAGTPLHLYLPGPHRGVWNEAALVASTEIILCESLIDALTFWCAGYRNVTASYGVEGFTADHLAALKTHGTERVLIAYDRDEAGDRAAEKLAKTLLAAGIDCYRILFPKGLDANEYALKVGPPAKSLGVVIRAAQWLGQGLAKPVTTTLSAMASSVAEPVVETVAVEGPYVAAKPLPSSSSLAAAAKDEIPSEPAIPAVAPPPLPLPAQVIPDAPRVAPTPEHHAVGGECELVVAYGPRRYRVRGLDKNLSYEVLKVNVLVSAPALDGDGEVDALPQAVHVDTLDLYQARSRVAFVKAAAVELGVVEDVIKGDLGRLLLALETEQEQLIASARAAKAPTVAPLETTAREEALAFLRRPDLIDAIASDFSRAGIVGETSNALVGYLAAVSRKLDRPLALLIQSTSAAGKSSLLDAVLKLVPEEDRVVYSAMTGQSLFYMGELNLKHKILAIAEEQGAARASYALKLLQSEGELTIASTSKDPTSGKLVTEEYRVEGPVMIALTTTAATIDEELLNRCLVLSVDEGRAQTQAIHQAQRERRTLAGLAARIERDAILTKHRNAQRLLEPLAVVNPYATHLTFVDDRTRTRRDHEKYLTLIDTIALLHQHQRVLRTAVYGDRPVRYVEVTLADIELANRLAHEVLGRTLDELPPQTRRLLGLVSELVAEACARHGVARRDYRFTRRDVREQTRWGDTQLKIHLARLVELEYLLVHRGGRGQSFEYELVYDGEVEREARRVSGLIDVEALRRAYDAGRSGSEAARSAAGRAVDGAVSAAGPALDPRETSGHPSETPAARDRDAARAHPRPSTPIASYVTVDRPAAPPLAAVPA